MINRTGLRILGKETKHKEEEYWSTTSIFHVSRQLTPSGDESGIVRDNEEGR
jgi:hypothetical protein